MSEHEPDNTDSSVVLPLLVLCVLGVAFFPVHVFNIPLFTVMNRFHTPVFDAVWLSFTTMGDGMLLTIVLGCFLLINPRVTFVGLFVMLMSSVLIHAIKLAFPVPRPMEVLESVHVVGPVLRWNAFPSGHAASAMSAAMSVAAFLSSRVWGTCAILLAGLISLSRIFVGAHFPLDVLGGTIAALAVFVVFKFAAWSRIRDRVPDKPVFTSRYFRVLFALEVGVALFSLFVYAPLFAESPPVAAFISFGVLVFLATGYRKQRPT